MKKSIFLISSLFVLVFLFFMQSCNKTESSSLILDMSKTCVVTGIVEAQLDLLNDSTVQSYELVPTTTKIIFQVKNVEYLIFAEGTTLYEANVASDGTFSIDIPAIESGVTVIVMPVDFTYDQGQAKFDPVLGKWVSDGTERKIYTSNQIVLEVYPGGTVIKDIFYNNN